jgi:predicted Zn-dependent protease
VAQGKPSEAIAEAQRARDDEPLADWSTAVLGMAYAAGGKRAEAEKLLAELNAKASRGWVPSFAFAEIYAGMHDKLHTLDALEKAYEERSWFLTYLNTAPEFDFLRSEPRFQALVRKMKFPARYHARNRIMTPQMSIAHYRIAGKYGPPDEIEDHSSGGR